MSESGVGVGRLTFVENSGHTIRCNANDGTGAARLFTFESDRVYNLPANPFSPPAGKRFAGWAGSNGRRYDDKMLVFNLAPPGETVELTAIWE